MHEPETGQCRGNPSWRLDNDMTHTARPTSNISQGWGLFRVYKKKNAIPHKDKWWKIIFQSMTNWTNFGICSLLLCTFLPFFTMKDFRVVLCKDRSLGVHVKLLDAPAVLSVENILPVKSKSLPRQTAQGVEDTLFHVPLASSAIIWFSLSLSFVLLFAVWIEAVTHHWSNKKKRR